MTKDFMQLHTFDGHTFDGNTFDGNLHIYVLAAKICIVCVLVVGGLGKVTKES